MIRKVMVMFVALVILVSASLTTVTADGPRNIVDADDYTIWRVNQFVNENRSNDNFSLYWINLNNDG